jgi:hypothetical protein
MHPINDAGRIRLQCIKVLILKLLGVFNIKSDAMFWSWIMVFNGWYYSFIEYKAEDLVLMYILL